MDWLAALIGAGASIISGITGSNAAHNAAQAQTQAIQSGIKLQQQGLSFQEQAYQQDRKDALQLRAQQRADAMPWLTAGKNALAQYQGELGLSKTGADGKPFKSEFTSTPGYQFALQQGNKGTVANLKALGLGGSGAALKALDRFNSGLANQNYQTYLDRLSGVSVNGQTQAGQQTQPLDSTAAASGINASLNGIGQSIANAGTATASGYVGGANAWSGALGNFANNAGSYLGGL